MTNCLSCQPVATESLSSMIIVIVTGQISLVLITVIVAVERLCLFIIDVECMGCQDNKIGIG